MVEIHRQKYFLMAKAATNSLPRRPPFSCVFKTSLREAYQRLGTETSPVIGFNCLLPVGQILVAIGSNAICLRTFQS